MAFNGVYYLLDENGNTIASKGMVQHLKEAFDRTGLDEAWIAYSADERLLKVTKQTPNSVWNEFTREHEYDWDEIIDYINSYSDYEEAEEESVIHGDPWEPMYQRMREELPGNDTEKEILEMLGQGKSISECLSIWVKNGYDKESFDVFMKKADEWETSHVCVSKEPED